MNLVRRSWVDLPVLAGSEDTHEGEDAPRLPLVRSQPGDVAWLLLAVVLVVVTFKGRRVYRVGKTNLWVRLGWLATYESRVDAVEVRLPVTTWVKEEGIDWSAVPRRTWR